MDRNNVRPSQRSRMYSPLQRDLFPEELFAAVQSACPTRRYEAGKRVVDRLARGQPDNYQQGIKVLTKRIPY